METAEQKSEGSKEDDPWADLDATLVSDDSFESSDEETDEETLEIELSRNRKRRENDPTSLIKSQVGVNSVVGEEHGGLDGAGGASYTAGGGMQIRMIQHLCFSNCAMELKYVFFFINCWSTKCENIALSLSLFLSLSTHLHLHTHTHTHTQTLPHGKSSKRSVQTKRW